MVPEDKLLERTLEKHLSEFYGRQRSVVALSRRDHPRRSSFRLEELHVTLEDDTRLSIILKDLSVDRLSLQADRSRTARDYDPECEIRAYREVLTGNLGTPRCYGAEVVAELGRYWLFLENVVGTELVDIGELSRWREAVRWLSRFQERFSAPESLPSGFRRYDDDFYRLWMQRAARAAPELAVRFGLDLEGFLRVRRNYQSIVARLAELPITVLHGDYYPSNVIVVEGPDDHIRVCPVDWGSMSVGPGLIDLAALTSGEWSEQERRRLVEDYWLGRFSRTVCFEEFLQILFLCRTFLSLQWLGSCAGRVSLPPGVRQWVRDSNSLYREAARRL